MKNEEKPSTNPRRVYWVDLGLTDYRSAWDLQARLVAARRSGRIERDLVISLEHPPTYTLGRRGGRENLTVSEAFLAEKRIPVIHVERGGNITYHGPGQVVIYPIIHLGEAGLGVEDYVRDLEEVMIRTAGDWDVEATRNPVNRGVWVGESKLGSVGIAVRHGITFHGLALNVNTDLEPFRWMNPCGLSGIEMTSLAKELGRDLPLERVQGAVKSHIQGVFGVALEKIDPGTLDELVES